MYNNSWMVVITKSKINDCAVRAELLNVIQVRELNIQACYNRTYKAAVKNHV